MAGCIELCERRKVDDAARDEAPRGTDCVSEERLDKRNEIIEARDLDGCAARARDADAEGSSLARKAEARIAEFAGAQGGRSHRCSVKL